MKTAIVGLVALGLACALTSVPVGAAPAPCSGGYVGLTFDDGPRPETIAILDALRAHQLRATFFLIGVNVQTYPDIARRIVEEGHEVANHSWDHPDLAQLTPEQIDWQVRATNNIITQVTGVTPRFMRPPFGSSNLTLKRTLADYNLVEVIWSQDSWDWMGATPAEILNKLTLVPPGGTLLMHDGVPNTLQAIPQFGWYFNTYWRSRPICSGRLTSTTNVQPVLQWLGQYYFARAIAW
jgi:peptidoglycan-N-acetylglucosamine deacetylase